MITWHMALHCLHTLVLSVFDRKHSMCLFLISRACSYMPTSITNFPQSNKAHLYAFRCESYLQRLVSHHVKAVCQCLSRQQSCIKMLVLPLTWLCLKWRLWIIVFLSKLTIFITTLTFNFKTRSKTSLHNSWTRYIDYSQVFFNRFLDIEFSITGQPPNRVFIHR